MKDPHDRLYELLPLVYRQRDAEEGWVLQALLRVITEQVNLVEADITQLYDNWFIETCQDWVVPYIGDLIGYRIVHEAGDPGDLSTLQGQQRNKILIPRREVANTLGARRRKGTLALLERLAYDVAGWAARAVEFYRLLGFTQSINHLRTNRGKTVDLRQGDALERLNGPFDELAHTVEVRRVHSHRTQGLYNIPSVGVFVWRLKSYSVTRTPAYCREEFGPHCYTFSVLGNDVPLYTKPERGVEPKPAASELGMPVPIRRRALQRHKSDYYGANKSLQIWVAAHPPGVKKSARPEQEVEAVPPEKIVVADLTDWRYRPRPGYVAVDPELGHIAFPPGHPPAGVWVYYHYGFSADIGGGEYNRPILQPSDPAPTIYQVGKRLEIHTITEALNRWKAARPTHAVIEITDSGVYTEQIEPIELEKDRSLQLRAANRTRPVLRLLDWQTDRPDDLTVSGEGGGCFILDGLLITGRGVQVQGNLSGMIIRHCTLVPGWGLHHDCEPRRPSEASLELLNTRARVTIEHSIIGSIQVSEDETATEPVLIRISDSILDATSSERAALCGPGGLRAYVALTVLRSTVFGQIFTHAIDLAENAIFNDPVQVARRQWGCVRFCYVAPGSRTPRRYNCQPDLVDQAVLAQYKSDEISESELPSVRARERLRVRPQFNSVRYGTPTYGQLSDTCADEIKRGADDESEMGVFHDLFQPQRAANLRARLDEYMPAGMEAGIIYAS